MRDAVPGHDRDRSAAGVGLTRAGIDIDAELLLQVLRQMHGRRKAAVHERLDQHHEQGQAKFLETAMRTEAPKLVPYVTREMKKAL